MGKTWCSYVYEWFKKVSMLGKWDGKRVEYFSTIQR